MFGVQRWVLGVFHHAFVILSECQSGSDRSNYLATLAWRPDVQIQIMSLLASFMNLAGPDLIVILLIILVLFGAKKLPELAKGMGQAVREFQKAKDEFSDELNKAGKTDEKTDSSGASKCPANRTGNFCRYDTARSEPNRRSRQPCRSGLSACRALFCHPERSRRISN
jgi:sec-independent protein translocase protein TatA